MKHSEHQDETSRTARHQVHLWLILEHFTLPSSLLYLSLLRSLFVLSFYVYFMLILMLILLFRVNLLIFINK